MKLLRKRGATSEIWQIFIADSSSTTGAGLTGLTNASSSLTAYYHRDTDTTATAISLVTMTVGTFTSSGFKEIDSANMPGWYQFCPPNAALATGARSCAFHLKGATNMAPLPIEVDLDGQADVTHWNGTAVPAENTAGVPLVDTARVAGTAQTARDLGASVLLSTGTGTGQLDFTGGVVKANVTQVNGVAAGTSDGTATAGAASTITLAAGDTAGANGYVDRTITLVGGTGAGQSRVITAYNSATKVATVHRAWDVNPDATSTYAIDPTAATNVVEVNGTAQTARDLGASVLLSVGTGTGQVNLSGGKVPATVAAGDATDLTTLLGRVPAALFAGITSLAQWLGLLAGKQAGNSTARAEVRATGAGSGTFDETTDALEAVRDRGDAAWATGGTAPTAAQNADGLLGRNLAGGSDGGRTVAQALAASRNKVTFDQPGAGQFTVYAADDVTPLWVGTYTRGANTLGPLTAVDPV